MIEYMCPHCNNTLHINAQFAGQTGKCNKCGKQITIPGAAPDPHITPSPQIFDTPDLGLDDEVFKDAPPLPVESDEGKSNLNATQVGQAVVGIGCLGILAFPIFVIGSCLNYEPAELTPEEQQQVLNDERYGTAGEAYIYSKDYAKRQLAYPAEAKFSFFHDRAVFSDQNKSSSILGSGTTKNGFGVKVEFTYISTMKKTGNRWTCEYIEVFAN